MTTLGDEKRGTDEEARDEEARDDELSEQELEAAAGGVLVEPTPVRRVRRDDGGPGSGEILPTLKGDSLDPTKLRRMTRTPYSDSK